MSWSVFSTSDARYMSFLNPTTISSAIAYSFVSSAGHRLASVASASDGAQSNSCTARRLTYEAGIRREFDDSVGEGAKVLAGLPKEPHRGAGARGERRGGWFR